MNFYNILLLKATAIILIFQLFANLANRIRIKIEPNYNKYEFEFEFELSLKSNYFIKKKKF